MAISWNQGVFTAWFDRLVKNKMVALAIPICGLALSCFLLSFAKLFSDLTFFVINTMSLAVFVVSCLQFVLVGSFQIVTQLKLKPVSIRSRGLSGKAVLNSEAVSSATAIEDQAAT
jgi:hypothetical protein